MIQTGPRIRALIEIGKERHGKKVREPYPIDCMVELGDLHDSMDWIHVDPYDPELVGPNSVDLRLGDKLLVYEEGRRRHECLNERKKLREPGVSTHFCRPTSVPLRNELDMKKDNETFELKIPDEGIVLWPGILYLGRTIECIGSNMAVPIVEGRSSVGRLGIHVHVTAGFCDLGFKGTITLEIHVIHPVRIYPNVPICQAYFLTPEGEIELYSGRYQNQVEPTSSRFGLSKEEFGGEGKMIDGSGS